MDEYSMRNLLSNAASLTDHNTSKKDDNIDGGNINVNINNLKITDTNGKKMQQPNKCPVGPVPNSALL